MVCREALRCLSHDGGLCAHPLSAHRERHLSGNVHQMIGIHKTASTDLAGPLCLRLLLRTSQQKSNRNVLVRNIKVYLW